MGKNDSLKLKNLKKLAENNSVKAVEELIRLALKTPPKTNRMIIDKRRSHC